MAKKTDPDDVTLYDLDPKFQDRLLKWLTKGNVVVDIAASKDPSLMNGFSVVFDPAPKAFPGGDIDTLSLEQALCDAMGSHYARRYIDPEFEKRVWECLAEHDAHLTFGSAGKLDGGEDGFKVSVGNRDARGENVDIDFEVALVLAEDEFLSRLPVHRMPADERSALEQALVPPAQREEEHEERQERLRRAFMEPRAELLENRQTVSYQRWCSDVDAQLAEMGARRQDSEYWRRLYQVGFTPAEAMVEFGAGVTDRAQWLRSEDPSPRPRRPMPTDPVELAYLENPYTLESHSRRTPPPPPRRSMASRAAHERGLPRVQRMSHEYDEKPFDPEAPREHYASAHHFAVNTRR